MIDRRTVAAFGLAAPLLTALGSRAFAQPAVMQVAPPTPQPSPPATESADDEPATQLGITDSATSHMLASVTVNGQGPFKFLVDTGANRSAIHTGLAEQLKLPAGPNVRLHTVIGARLRPTAIIDQLQVGARALRRVRAPTLSITGMSADGILGVDWLKGSRLTFDFREKRLDISSSRGEAMGVMSYGDRSGIEVPARLRSGQITIIDADMSGRRLSAMIDTGSELSLGNAASRELIRSSQEPQAKETLEIITVTGERMPGELLYVPFLRLGGLLLGNVPIVFAKVHVFSLWDMERQPSLILGMDLLRQFASVSMDYGRARVRFEML